MEVDAPVIDTADGVGIHLDTVDREFENLVPAEKQPTSETTLKTDITEEDDKEHIPDTKSLVKRINSAAEIIDLTDYDDEDYYYDDDEDLDALDATTEFAVNVKPLSVSAAEQEEKKEEPEELVVKPTSSSKEENSKSGSEKEEPELLAVGKQMNAKPSPVKPDADSIQKSDSYSEEDGSKPDEKPISNTSSNNSKRSPKKKKKKSKKKMDSRPSEKEESRPSVKRESRTTVKTESRTTEKRESIPSPKKQDSRPSPKKQRLSDFKIRKLAKEKRASELQMLLGVIGDTLTVEQRSDDSVSFITIPKDFEDSDGEALHKSLPLDPHNPMLAMGDEEVSFIKKQESIPSPKKQDSSDKRLSDFKVRKLAKKKRSSELQMFLGGIGDTLTVEQRSDDSVSFMTVPKDFADGDGEALHKLRPSDPHNPMLAMGDEEAESLPRLSYGLEALMNQSNRARDEKWENVSDTTEEVETVIGEDLDEEMGLMSVDLQPSGMEPHPLETSVLENERGGIVSKVKSISQAKTINATLATSIIGALIVTMLAVILIVFSN